MDHLRPGMLVEFALKLKSGVLVARSPLHAGGKKVPLADRKIHVYRPRRPLEPGQIAKDRAKAGDPQLVYRITGKRENEVTSISMPRGGAMRNAVDGAKIDRAFLGKDGARLDKRGVTSKTAASAYATSVNSAAIPTDNLRKHYEKKGYVTDRPEMMRMLVNARTPEHRDVVRSTLKNFVPMVRRPRSSPK